MTRRSPRAACSSQERPRLAGKEPGPYRATTMFVHFRETPYGLAMSVVENRRENGKVRHEHVVSLGSIETPPQLPPALNSGANCTRGWPSFPTDSTLKRGTRSWARCMLGFPWSHLTNNAMPSDDHRLLKSPALAALIAAMSGFGQTGH